MGTGDKPLLTAYSNISEKHFIYGNTSLNLGGFTPRTHFLHKLKTEIQERKKVLQGLQLPSLLLVCSFTSGRLPLHCWLLLERLEKSGTATCSWSFKQQFRHDNIPIYRESHQDVVTWRTGYWQKPPNSSLQVCKNKSLPLQYTISLVA